MAIEICCFVGGGGAWLIGRDSTFIWPKLELVWGMGVVGVGLWVVCMLVG